MDRISCSRSNIKGLWNKINIRNGIQLETQEQIKAKIEGSEFKEADDKQIELDNINLDIKKLKIALKNATENMDQLGKASVDSGEAIFAAAEKFLGVDYVMGGSGMSGTDCGKLTMDAYAAAGIELARRTADAQLAQMEDAGGFHNDKSKLKKGDLVFYDTKYMPVSDDRSALNANDQAYKANHVGIYQGKGKILHAGSSTGVAENIDMDFAKVIGFGDYTALGGTAQQQRIKMTQEKSGKYADFIKSLLEEGDKILQEAAEAAGDVSGQQIAEINKQYNQTVEKFQNNHMPQKYIDAAEKVKAIKVGQINFAQTQQDLEYANNDLAEFQGSLAKSVSDSTVSAKALMQAYIERYHEQTDKYRKQLEDQLRAAQSQGLTGEANKIKAALKALTEGLQTGLENLISAYDSELQMQIAEINANRKMTRLQKQDAIDAAERRKYGVEADKAEKDVDDYERRSKEENIDYSVQIRDKKREAELKRGLSEIPPLLNRIHEASTQAFEDGLLDFLTKGILECESLGEAFRNLAITILESIQKVFAEDMTKNIMTSLGFGDKYKAPSSNQDGTGAEAALSGSFGAVTTETNGFLVTFSTQMNEFSIRAQGAFQGILQNISAAANSIPSVMPSFSFGGSGAGSGSGGFEYNSSTGSNWWNSLPSFSGGGVISSDGVITGPGTGTSDSILARVGNGEGILNVEAMKMLGSNFLRRANSGDIYNLRVSVPKFARGGVVGNAGASATAKGMAMFSQDIGANMSPTINNNTDVRIDGGQVAGAFKGMIEAETKSYVRNNIMEITMLAKRTGRI